MASFKITIKNRSINDHSFILLQDIQVAGNSGQNNVFSNVYQSSPDVSGRGASTEFVMKQQYYAIHGTSSETDDGSICVNVSDSIPARLGPKGTIASITTVDGDGTDPTWDRSHMTNTTEAQGSFELRADNTFNSSNPSKTNISVRFDMALSVLANIPQIKPTWVAVPLTRGLGK